MPLIPNVVRTFLRKTFIGHTLDEVVEELKKMGVTKVSISGEAESISDSPIDHAYKFYVYYQARIETGEWIDFKEFTGRANSIDCSIDWKEYSNQLLDQHREVLQKELGAIEVQVQYSPERVHHYLNPNPQR